MSIILAERYSISIIPSGRCAMSTILDERLGISIIPLGPV
jgi:hypothetical protein